MKRYLMAFLAMATGVACTLAMPGSAAAQFPFPVAHYSVVDDAGPGSDAGCCATEFDGSTEYLSHTDATGWTDSKVWTASIWFKRDAVSATHVLFSGGTSSSFAWQAWAVSDNTIRFRAWDSPGGTIVLDARSVTTITDTNWHHVMWSVDLSSAANRSLYIDDTLDATDWVVYDNTAMDWTAGTYAIGANFVDSGHFDGALSEVWIDTGSYIDLSVTANRRKFIDAGGLPVDVGSDGSTPTGSAPEIYMSDVSGTNTGTTANFSQIGSPTSVDGPNP